MQVKMLDDGKRLGVQYSGFRDDWFYAADYQGYTYKLVKGSKEKIDRRLADLALVMVGDPTDLPSSSIIDIPAVLPPAARRQYKTLEKRDACRDCRWRGDGTQRRRAGQQTPTDDIRRGL